MSLKSQKRLAAKILKVGESRVWIDPERIEEVSTAIIRDDIRKLIHEGAIKALPRKDISRARTRVLHRKKLEGLRRKHGSRKGTKGARTQKQAWAVKIRAIRNRLRELRDQHAITKRTYRSLYRMAKGGAFKSVSRLEQYLQAHKLVKK